MKQNSIMRVMTPIFALALFLSGLTVSAHEGVEHSTAEETALHDKLTETQMQTIITLLQKLIVLLKAKNEALHAVQQIHDAVADEQDHTETIATAEEMEMHHDEHSDTPLVETEHTEVRKLVIEVEEHNSSTHVHVRYVDKSEEMFFVDALMTDEAGVIADIVTKTGLTETEVSEAIVHSGM